MNDKNKKELLERIKSQKIMSLATRDEKVDICTVFYVVDKDFNLYFISEPDSQHCRNIIKNKDVACNIVDSSQKVTDKKIGVQAQGEATEVTGSDKIITLLKMWNSANPGIASILNYENIKKRVINSKVYKISPNRIKFFNEEIYSEEGYEILEF